MGRRLMLKTCKTCKIEKNISEFYFRKENGTYRSECKTCILLDRQKYHEEHREEKLESNKRWREDNEDYVRAKRKETYETNKPIILQQSKDYYWSHKSEKQEYDKQYRIDNREEINEYNRNYSKNKRNKDPRFKLRTNISRLIVFMLKENNGSKAGKSIIDFLPYSTDELKNHLEKQFEPWMTWNNYGTYKVRNWIDDNPATWTWQLDHIIPQSVLPYASMEEENFQKCWALSNLRPYSSKQNNLDGTTKIRHK
jgi:hypothetical protein